MRNPAGSYSHPQSLLFWIFVFNAIRTDATVIFLSSERCIRQSSAFASNCRSLFYRPFFVHSVFVSSVVRSFSVLTFWMSFQRTQTVCRTQKENNQRRNGSHGRISGSFRKNRIKKVCIAKFQTTDRFEWQVSRAVTGATMNYLFICQQMKVAFQMH